MKQILIIFPELGEHGSGEGKYEHDEWEAADTHDDCEVVDECVYELHGV